jgi:hypothetical protein
MGLNAWAIAGSVIVLYVCYMVLKKSRPADA